ncbi:S49 family peptidase [Oharaeibacter diazotrophicus]|uniref:ClpP class serine protease n=1 Tax=Oharaeibacter diazotrophicus TaxID=1920512 RepID=A0A4R6RGW9_9HYPH|nr:S49 family peptidase [Oharaeibacter diazotrophicus]TDP85385.1 ClpP class serine protease [Oharaeibacter diazotrophicus]BBE74355.1 putative signal peptide peptidase SppA [Pleomorphomonas sp. SM30]GLS75952.1 hypothetical protein GCM10007904_12870 [Oharaeibacter diazotrophicus]
MDDLGLTLAAVGQPLLMERRAAGALVSRYADGFRASAPAGGAAQDGQDAGRRAARPLAYAGGGEWRDGYRLAGRIAVIEVCGILTARGYYDWWTECFVPGYAQIGAAFALAQADPDVGAVMLRIDSPGGLADGAFDLAAEIRAGRAQAGGKPVWVHTSWALSAAYAVASAADRVLSTAQGYTGSIGVVVLHVDESEWLAKIGLKTEAIESSPGKTAGAAFKPLDDAARADIQADVDQIAGDFIACVTAGRGLTAAAIRAQNARIFLGRHADATRSAEALGLIDGIATEREAFASLAASLAASPVPSPTSGPGASRAKAPKTRRESKEKAMSLKIQMAGLRAKAEAGDGNAQEVLDQIEAILTDEEKSLEDKLAEIEVLVAGAEEETAAEDAGETAEAGDGAQASAKRGKPRAKAAKSGGADGFAVLDLPEAKGREQLAGQLGRKVAAGKISVDEARDLLAAAPKASGLREAMAGRDTPIGPGGAGKPGAATLADSMKATLARQGIKV